VLVTVHSDHLLPERLVPFVYRTRVTRDNVSAVGSMDGVLADLDREAEISRRADAEQAEYFRQLLSSMRLTASGELARYGIELQRAMNVGRAARAKELRHLIRVQEAELRTLDRLGETLSQRLDQLRSGDR
jgi:hypothetical protein